MLRRSFAAVLTASLVAGLIVVGSGLADAANKKAAPKAKKEVIPVVEVVTSLGSFEIELAPDKAPKTVENFLAYVDAKFYDGLVFHRVIEGFMIQGGGYDAKLNRKATRDPVVNEAKTGLGNARGTVAMARTGDPHSATAQFFVNVKDNKRLDYTDDANMGYCAFGKVTKGMDVVDKIRAVPTGSQGGMADVPTTPVVIERVRRVK
jgi:cyclophilin family peptidyl-prolyl cis-trans isomerase